MILHLVTDEKFIDIAFRIFEEVYPNNNECIVLSDTKELTFIKSTPCSVVNTKMVTIKKLAASFKKYEAVIFHSLDNPHLRILNRMPEDITTVWLGFGHDYYDLITKSRTDLFDLKTKELFVSLNSRIDLGRRFLKNDHLAIVRAINKIKPFLLRRKSKRRLVNKITYFAPVLNEEFRIVKKTFGHEFKPQFLDWNYGTLEDDLVRGYENISLKSNNILLGNSASYENNHLEAFEILANLNLQHKKIITPLSYCDPEYRTHIAQEGKKLFFTNFIPLIDFMPIDEYLKVISSCSIVIMNHIRQQALGNIITMMYLGATVFLKKENPIHVFFKKEGAIIFSTDELEKNHKLIDFRLSKNDVEKNKKILKLHWSRDKAHLKTKELIKAIHKRNNA